MVVGTLQLIPPSSEWFSRMLVPSNQVRFNRSLYQVTVGESLEADGSENAVQVSHEPALSKVRWTSMTVPSSISVPPRQTTPWLLARSMSVECVWGGTVANSRQKSACAQTG